MSRDTGYVFASVLVDLVAAGAILTAYIIEDGDGRFHTVARSTNGIDHRIKLKRGGERTFKSLVAAAKLLREMGVSRIQLHMNAFAHANAPLLFMTDRRRQTCRLITGMLKMSWPDRIPQFFPKTALEL